MAASGHYYHTYVGTGGAGGPGGPVVVASGPPGGASSKDRNSIGRVASYSSSQKSAGSVGGGNLIGDAGTGFVSGSAQITTIL
ncbi:hypothetical protein ZHAS_00018419 [Anopheles sinensis]|uniref:Uncharacterized protein n=1 Tax=Anopheles sinensis TaxID=74873 RepID=A0A084WJK0_ANOSI|nr:hypothetical protein ZHAS_00018419 [Anopheles sinensis]